MLPHVRVLEIRLTYQRARSLTSFTVFLFMHVIGGVVLGREITYLSANRPRDPWMDAKCSHQLEKNLLLKGEVAHRRLNTLKNRLCPVAEAVIPHCGSCQLTIFIGI